LRARPLVGAAARDANPVRSPPVRDWCRRPNAIRDAIDYAKFYSRLHDAVIRVYDESGNVIETHEHAGDFKECS
jgi:hypothetical protein